MPTTTDKPLEGLPVNGVFPLTLSPAFKATLGKGKGAKEDVIGLKCTRLALNFRGYLHLLSSLSTSFQPPGPLRIRKTPA